MDADVRQRLLDSIEADRLVIFCGAGLSMAPPSNLPSAAELTNICVEKYELETGIRLPVEARADLEKLAEYFGAREELYSRFISRLVPHRRFVRAPNAGHMAAADFLVSGIVECVVSTNFDFLIEEAAKVLGEPDYKADIDGDEANTNRGRKPHLKIHGCLIRDDRNTLWCKSQLGASPLKERHTQFKTWLKANLRERDLIFLGFWSDWAYLNEIFEDALGGIDKGLVVIVNRSDEAQLKSKAAQLWAWSGGEKVKRFVVNESAGEFLAELRFVVWRAFTDRLHRESLQTYSALTGRPDDPAPAMPCNLSCEDLYSLHLDACGVPLGEVARKKRPDATMQVLGAVQMGLIAEGAQLEGNQYLINGARIRVVYGQGRVLSDIRKLYQDEPAAFVKADTIICVGAKDDGGMLPDVVRIPADASTIIRPTPTANWLTEDAAKPLWAGRIGQNVVNATR
jgi:hypothetical protein